MPLVYALVLVLMSGCGDGEGEVQKSRCQFSQTKNEKNLNYCVEYAGLTEEQRPRVKEVCLLETKGDWQDSGSCSRISVKGQCHFKADSISFSYFYYPDFNVELARSNCASAGGSWQGS